MKRILPFILSALFFVAISLSAYAQTDISYKSWTDGPLTREDFTLSTPYDGKIGEIVTGIETYTSDWEKVKWNLRVKRLGSKSVFDPIRSWLTKEDSLTSQALRYAQLCFDATEVTRRKMQNYLSSGTHDPNYSFAVRRFFNMHDARSEELDRITDKGRNLAALQEQEHLVANELDTLVERTAGIPKYTLRKLAVGAHIGASSQFHTGKYSEYFTPAYGFLWGLGVAAGKSEFYLDMVLGGGSKLLKDISGKKLERWEPERKLRYGEMTLQYGYSFYDGDTFKIGPFAGVGVGFLDYDNPVANSDIKTDEIAGLRLVGGLNIQFKYLRSLYLVGDYVWSSIYGGINEHSLKLKIYVARTAYGNGMNPYSINCSLSFDLMSKHMKP